MMRRRQRGVILLALLITMALAQIALLGALELSTLERKREREDELLFVGQQYRSAILRYYYANPAGQPRLLPRTLDDLIKDPRYPMSVRHLRRLYKDPISGGSDWGLVMKNGGIAGVFSPSDEAPLKKGNFPPGDEAFEGKAKYRDWLFVASVIGS